MSFFLAQTEVYILHADYHPAQGVHPYRGQGIITGLRGWVIKVLLLQGHLEQQRSYSCKTRTLSAFL